MGADPAIIMVLDEQALTTPPHKMRSKSHFPYRIFDYFASNKNTKTLLYLIRERGPERGDSCSWSCGNTTVIVLVGLLALTPANAFSCMKRFMRAVYDDWTLGVTFYWGIVHFIVCSSDRAINISLRRRRCRARVVLWKACRRQCMKSWPVECRSAGLGRPNQNAVSATSGLSVVYQRLINEGDRIETLIAHW